MFAITPLGAGNPVNAREVKSDAERNQQETFCVDDFSHDMVLSDDNRSLRKATSDELTAIVASCPAYGRIFESVGVKVTPPDKSGIMDAVAFFDHELADDEYMALRSAAEKNVVIARWVDRILSRGNVELLGQKAVAAKDELVKEKVLTPERASNIFSTSASRPARSAAVK